MVTDFWTESGEIERALFDRSKAGDEVELYYIDLALLHEFNSESNDFFEALANTENLMLFDLEIVKRIIMFKWPLV